MSRFDGPRRLTEHQKVQKLGRKLEQLRFELAVQAPRRTLDYLLEHVEDLLGSLDNTELKRRYQDQVSRARGLITERHNLRLVPTPGGAKFRREYMGEWADACSHDEGNEAS